MNIPYDATSRSASQPEDAGGAYTSLRPTQHRDDSSTAADGHPTPSVSEEQGSSSSDADRRWSIDSREFQVKYWFGDQGRVNVKVNRNSTWLDDGVLSQQPQASRDAGSRVDHDDPPPYEQFEGDHPRKDGTPALRVVMHVAGSHDEVSHFIAVARNLQEDHGHRVRIATHPEFRGSVEDHGIEFYDIGASSGALGLFMGGGDLKVLESRQQHLRENQVTRGTIIRQVMSCCWQSCVYPGSDGSVFVADAIIANPPSFAHMHCAEKLGVPLHIMSTTPWTPTRAVAHPLVDIEASDLGPQLTNRLSYSVAELMLWKDIGDFVNDFREKDLGVAQMQTAFSPGLLMRLNCPITYFRSSMCPARPDDWPDHVQFYDHKSQVAMGTEDSDTTISEQEHEIRFAAQHFLSQLRVREMRCAVLDNQVAAWKVGSPESQVSAVVAAALQRKGLIKVEALSLYRSREYDLENRPHDPVSSIAAETYDTIGNILLGVAAGPMEAYRIAQQEKQGRASPGQPANANSSGDLNPYSAVAISSAKGMGSAVAASLKMPVTLTHGLAQGFHNVPRLYGDATVRDSERVTGMRTGLAAAGKGLAYGLYDGLTGFVTQPYRGAKEDGARGFLKGFGKGLGGIVFKPAAGACAVPGYAFLGAYKELKKAGQTSEKDFVKVARLAQGEIECSTLSENEVRDIVEAWASIRASMGQKR